MGNRAWTPAEIEFLLDNYHRYTAEFIGKKLGRTTAAVGIKASDLNIRRNPDVLSQNEVAAILGVDHHWVMKLRRWGVLEGKRYATRGKTSPWRFREEDVVRMIRDHGHLFDHEHIDPAYRQYHADQWVTLGDCFRRGAAHLVSLSHACNAGLIPEARKRGAYWVVPERIVASLVAARRRYTTDAEHQRQLRGYERAQRRYEAERKVVAYRRVRQRGEEGQAA